MFIPILHCISVFIAVCALILDIGFLDSIIILAYMIYILITRSDFLTCTLHRLYGWDGTTLLILYFSLSFYLSICTPVYYLLSVSLFSAQVAWSLNCASLYIYMCIYTYLYLRIRLYIYMYIYVFLIPFYLRLFTSLQFSTPCADACTNRASLLRPPRTSRLT